MISLIPEDTDEDKNPPTPKASEDKEAIEDKEKK
jgi:hypothetical protein